MDTERIEKKSNGLNTKSKLSSEVDDLSFLTSEQQKTLEAGKLIGPYGNQIMRLHFHDDRERRGVGTLISSASHIALIVKDVGQSATFYSEVLGLP